MYNEQYTQYITIHHNKTFNPTHWKYFMCVCVCVCVCCAQDSHWNTAVDATGHPAVAAAVLESL